MGKLTTFGRYLKDFISNGQYIFILTAVKYKIFGKTTRKHRLYNGKLGLFYSRKGSLDFQFGNYAYEWNVKKHILDNYKDYDVFLDIGSNIGTYTILLASKGMRTYAFEPVKSNFNALSINILLNNIQEKVKAFNFGLGDEEKDVTFIFDPVNTGASHFEKSKEEGIHKQVKIKRLDDVIDHLDLAPENKILCKIDVEGMEIKMLDGAEKFLKSFPNLHLVLETEHSGVDDIKNKLREIADFKFVEIDNLNIAAIKK